MNDGVPVPKVIDFGIAKATQGTTDRQTLFTAFEQFIGTPAYMSPEQAEMSALDIDTRSDIYCAGRAALRIADRARRPFDAKELLAGRAWTKCGGPSGRRNRRGPRPLEHDAGRRTDHDGQTAADRAAQADPSGAGRPGLDRDEVPGEGPHAPLRDRQRPGDGHPAALDNEPLVARPPSKLYRFQKMVRRNKLAFGRQPQSCLHC